MANLTEVLPQPKCSLCPSTLRKGERVLPGAQGPEGREELRAGKMLDGPFPPHRRNAVCLQKKLGLVSISSTPTQAA